MTNKPLTYRHRKIVEAMLYDGTKESIEAICKWTNAKEKLGVENEDPWIDYLIDENNNPSDVICNTIYGPEMVIPSDYVVWDGNHFFPYSNKTFCRNYELWKRI